QLRVVDNSEIERQAMMEGRSPRCIHIYNKRGMRYIESNLSKHCYMNYSGVGILVPKIPKFDSNNLVLVDDILLGTRIQVPIPHILRTKIKEQTHSKGADYTNDCIQIRLVYLSYLLL
ncbi:39S ribosomal protein L14, mitochondrial, partial [Trachymyrmex cornetzi]